jgi:hypothetical protein
MSLPSLNSGLLKPKAPNALEPEKFISGYFRPLFGEMWINRAGLRISRVKKLQSVLVFRPFASEVLHASHPAVAEPSSSSSISTVSHEPSTVYVNPICLQMDQTILKAASCEDLLTVLVTHRGVLFVQNLITALSSLSVLSQQKLPFSVSKTMERPDELEKITQDKILEDSRYLLLIRDLIEHSSKLDVKSIDSILKSLQTLDHCHYKLFGALLRRLYAIELHASEVSIVLSIGQTLQWGGFGKADTFFNRLSDTIMSSPSLSHKDLLNSLILYSKLPSVNTQVLGHVSELLQCHLVQLSPRELGITAIAVSEYGDSIPGVPTTVRLIADHLLGTRQKTGLRDVIRVAISLRRTNVDHSIFLKKSWTSTVEEIHANLQLKERIEPKLATISDIASLVDACGHFGLCRPQDLSHTIIPYVSDHIDLVTEEAAIKLLFGLSTCPEAVTLTNALAVSLLMRKIASATDSWERHKSKLMTIFFSKILQFDFVESEMKKFVIDSCLAHWLLSRRGYGVPYPEVSKSMFSAVNEALEDSSILFNEWIPNSPYNGDIVFPNEKIVVFVLSRFSDTGRPVGIDLVQVDLVRRLGWHVIPVDRKKLMGSLKDTVDDLQIDLAPRLNS